MRQKGSEKLDDSKIIELFFERSEQAIIELSKKYNPLCKKIANNILNNSLDTEECVNDAYLVVWNTVQPQNPNPLNAYICKIVRNLAIKKYHNNTAIKRNSYYDVSLDELENCLSNLNTLEDEHSLKILSKEIDSFLDNLTKENRVIFVRRYWFADSISDIAEKVSISEHNISARLFRLRENLKKHLRKAGYNI